LAIDNSDFTQQTNPSLIYDTKTLENYLNRAISQSFIIIILKMK